MKNAFGLSSIIVFGTSTVWTSNVVPAKIGDSRGGSPDILAKSLAKIFKNNEKKKKLKIFSGFASDLAIKSGDPQETLRGGLRTISARTTLTAYTVLWQYRLRSFQGMDTKLDRVWLKTNYYQIKSLNFVNWFIGEVFDNINF